MRVHADRAAVSGLDKHVRGITDTIQGMEQVTKMVTQNVF